MDIRHRKVVIVGATSAMAEHCARHWVMVAEEMVLIGRERSRLDVIAADLAVRNAQTKISVMTLADFTDPQQITQIVDAVMQDQRDTLVLIAHGWMPEQQECQRNLRTCADALQITGVSPALFAEAFAGHMQQINAGTLAVIGSVAGDRGRRSNYVYGAAKGLLTRYVQGLQHRFAASGVTVILIKPGPTETPMTLNAETSKLKLAGVEDVAQQIVSGVAGKKAVIYAPSKWMLIMWVIRHMPQFIFNRMDI